MKRRLGIDPGKNSAGVALIEGDAITWWAVSRMTRGYRLRSSAHEESRHADLHSVGSALVSAVGLVDAVVVEGQYIARDGQRTRSGAHRIDQRSIIEVAYAAGELCGPLRLCGPFAPRPLASEWRAALGLSGMVAEGAEQAAIDLAARRFVWPEFGPGWLTRVELGAVCEAAFIAIHGCASAHDGI